MKHENNDKNNELEEYDEEIEFYRNQLMDDEDIAFIFGRGNVSPPPEPDK